MIVKWKTMIIMPMIMLMTCSSNSEFEFSWCDIEPNFVEPDLPDFHEPVGISSEASSNRLF